MKFYRLDPTEKPPTIYYEGWFLGFYHDAEAKNPTVEVLLRDECAGGEQVLDYFVIVIPENATIRLVRSGVEPSSYQKLVGVVDYEVITTDKTWFIRIVADRVDGKSMVVILETHQPKVMI